MPFLCAPRLGEISYDVRQEPQGIDDPDVPKITFGTTPAKHVLGNLEARCRLCGCEQALAGVIQSEAIAADHGLTKILVRA